MRPHAQREELRSMLEQTQMRQRQRGAGLEIECKPTTRARPPLTPLFKLRRVVFQRAKHIARWRIRRLSDESCILEILLPLSQSKRSPFSGSPKLGLPVAGNSIGLFAPAVKIARIIGKAAKFSASGISGRSK